MSYTDDSSDREWKEIKPKPAKSTRHDLNASPNKPKYFQRFCEKWLKIFSPWLTRCDDNPNKPFCRACKCRLDCNRCHLQRHSRTSKHRRNLEVLINKGESVVRENLSIRQERSRYYTQRKTQNESDTEIGMDVADVYIDEGDNETDMQLHFEQSEILDQYSEEQIVKQELDHQEIQDSSSRNYTSNESNSDNIETSAIEKERMKILMQIQKDKNNLMDSVNELVGNNVLTQSSSKEKNHVDLFFDSVRSSVKALTPKLIAEAKMRVSQLICELELRALTEGEIGASVNNTGSTAMLSSDTDTPNTFIVRQQMGSLHQKSGTHSQFGGLS